MTAKSQHRINKTSTYNPSRNAKNNNFVSEHM